MDYSIVIIVFLNNRVIEHNLIVGLSAQPEVEDLNTLEQEESTSVFLPSQVFTELETQEDVGLFFSVYESPQLFPLAENSNPNDVIGSPVVGASVAENLDVFDGNIIIMLRLNDSVSLKCICYYTRTT